MLIRNSQDIELILLCKYTLYDVTTAEQQLPLTRVKGEQDVTKEYEKNIMFLPQSPCHLWGLRH